MGEQHAHEQAHTHASHIHVSYTHTHIHTHIKKWNPDEHCTLHCNMSDSNQMKHCNILQQNTGKKTKTYNNLTQILNSLTLTQAPKKPWS